MRTADTPGTAKRMAQRVTLRDGWSKLRVKVMRQALLLKFVQNPELGRKLIETGVEYLQEGNRWHDTFWGVDLNTGVGENTLGILLMELRTALCKGQLVLRSSGRDAGASSCLSHKNPPPLGN